MVKIFVSSTIDDLHYLRDSIRDTIAELGHLPVLSEYGEIGYLPTASAEESCYIAIRDCDLAVMIVGKRYGWVSGNGFSVTHNEFLNAKGAQLPIITLIDQEVLSFLKVYDRNKVGLLEFPGMENPDKVFAFIKEIKNLPVNNGIIPFSNTQSAKVNFRKQLNFLFADLLRKNFNPSQKAITDILAEIVTLRHNLMGAKDAQIIGFIHAFRVLTYDSFAPLLKVIQQSCGPLEVEIPKLLVEPTFKAYLDKRRIQIFIMTNEEIKKMLTNTSTQKLANDYGLVDYWLSEEGANFIISNDESVELQFAFVAGGVAYRANNLGDKKVEDLFAQLKAEVAHEVSRVAHLA
jgi:hypothetical protein